MTRLTRLAAWLLRETLLPRHDPRFVNPAVVASMRVPVFILFALIAGCAQTPETPAPAPLAAAPSGAEGDELIAAVEQAIKEGYKIRNEKGQRLFCRKDLKTGTRVRSSIKCLTEDELLAEQRGARDFVETIQRQPNRMHE